MSEEMSAPELSLVERMTRKKTVEQTVKEIEAESSGSSGPTLKRALGLWDLVAYGLGSTVGAGIFVTTGKAAHTEAGPAVFLSFLISSFACLLSALCYAEFAARVPVSGSAYSFAYTTLGEAAAWFIGWNLTLEYGISAAAVARGWADYFANFFASVGLTLPWWMNDIDLGGSYFSRASPLAAGIVLLVTIVLLLGVKESSRFNMVITVLNVIIIGFIVIYGSAHVDPANWTPFAPHGASGVFTAAGIVFFSYVGFDAVCTLADEVKDPKRDLPRGIVLSLVASTLLYVAVAIVITGMVPSSKITLTAPLSDAFLSLKLNWAGSLVAFGSVTTLTATTLCSVFGQPRIFYRMAKDGLLFSAFASVSKNQIPYIGTIVTGLSAGLIALVFDINELTNMISIGTLLAFSVVCASVLILRYDEPEQKKPVMWLVVSFFFLSLLLGPLQTAGQWVLFFIVLAVLVAEAIALWRMRAVDMSGVSFVAPYCPWLPCVGIAFNSRLIMGLPIASLYRLLIWTAIGFIIYFAYGVRNSKLNGRAAPYSSDVLVPSDSDALLADSPLSDGADSAAADEPVKVLASPVGEDDGSYVSMDS
eukprot:PLAT1762.1.p1 GENE.PLAT1762.1~~PLAT1762.1.p1  ORF type:complete len:604 (-),score=320.92 PLAT1762.1:106-1875(-)